MLANTKWSPWGRWILTCCLLLIGCGVFLQWAKTLDIGANDFRAYWAASRLFLEGRNPYDQQNLWEMQHLHFQTDADSGLMVWNPPTVWIFLLPVAWLPGETARAVWLLVNVVLVLGSCFLLRQIYFPTRSIVALAFYWLIAMTFAPVLVAILVGQITFLVLFGLTTALFFIKREQWFWAGVMLIFTTIKPHLVMLAVPYLLLYMAVQRKWRGWLGLLTAGGACLAILFAFRPAWIADFNLLLHHPPTNWLTPTLGGIMKLYGLGNGGQYLGFIFLLLLPILLKRPAPLTVESAVSILTLITVPTTFFGWSFDQSILLAPIAQIVAWLSDPSCSNKVRWGVSGSILITLMGNLGQRTVARNDSDYWWVPFVWGAIYLWAWWGVNRKHPKRATEPIESIAK